MGQDRTALIGDRKRMCAAFFHGRWCSEIGVSTLCVLEDHQHCPKNVCVGVVRLLSNTQKEKAVVRYTNCFQGSTHTNIHAEAFLVRDKQLRALLQRGDTIVLYLSYQPCHHNGGGRWVRKHETSCTQLLCDWATKTLAPLDIRLEIRCSDIFRAGWTDPGKFASEKDAALFHARCEAAREGIRMLHRTPHVSIGGFESKDWEFLWTLSHPLEFTAEEKRARMLFDEKIGQFIAQLNPSAKCLSEEKVS